MGTIYVIAVYLLLRLATASTQDNRLGIGGHDICHSSRYIVRAGYYFSTQDSRVVIGGHDICHSEYLLLRLATASILRTITIE